MADGGCVFVPPFFAGGLKVSTLRRLWDGMGWDDGDDAWRYQVISTTTTYFFFATVSLFFSSFYPFLLLLLLLHSGVSGTGTGTGSGYGMEWNGMSSGSGNGVFLDNWY
jgi:hypothetical protein